MCLVNEGKKLEFEDHFFQVACSFSLGIMIILHPAYNERRNSDLSWEHPQGDEMYTLHLMYSVSEAEDWYRRPTAL
jgi:hypothetical protein